MCMMDASRGGAHGDAENININDHEQIQNKEHANSNVDGATEVQFFHGLLRRIPVNKVLEEVGLLGKAACPVATTTFLVFSKSIISMLFLSHMGKTELAGGALAIGFANVTGLSIMKGLCMGMDPICFQAFGAKRLSVLSQMYIKTCILLLLTSVPVTFLWLNMEPVFQQLGQDRVITKVAAMYLTFSLPELPALAHLLPLRSLLRAQGLNSPASIVATCATILHLPINYFFITYLNLGVKGIAISSTCFTYNMNIGLLIYIFMSKVAIKPWVARSRASLFSIFQGWAPLLSMAIPSLFSVCLEWWWYEIVLFLSGLLENPESSVAATGIIMQTTGAIYVMPFALSLSISQRVGHELGAGQPARARLAAIVGISIAFIYGLVVFGLSITLRNVLGKLYTNDVQILSLLSSALPVTGLAEVGNSPQTAACGALTGSARPKVGVRINIAAFYLIGLPLSIILAFVLKIGYRGLWLGLVASQAACASLMVYTLVKTDWKDQAKRAEEMTLAMNKDDDTELNELVP
ncbi:protein DETOXIFICATION 53-like [Cynara cardunculus var. scolymus]|uniref:protein DETOXIFICATION 53-like n=1 Tax=Cynara cardunculus var. scolymus TaxID=59895 RepID=UPI000D62A5BB|nr:protein DETOXIFICATION 53-like [Cynara cardunculus var. scolymus]